METSVITQAKKEEKEQLEKSTNVEMYVRHYFVDTPIMTKIAYCESRFRQYTVNGKILRGEVNHADVGVMQINEYYHLERAQKMGLDIYTLPGNLAYARDLYEREGARPWMSSSPCWAKFTLADEIAKN